MLDLDFVTDADPVVPVRVASQQHLPVVAIGVATILVEALRVTFSGGVHRSAKVCMPMRLSNVYVIPGIASRLFSCRWGFDRDDIGTSLDADLCLTLPTGEVVPFVERGIHYPIDTLPFDKATRRGGASRATFRLRHYVLRRGSLGRLRSYATAPFFSDHPGTSYGLLRLSMYILFCIATAKPDFAVLFSGPPHTQCPATSRCGDVSVCFLCGSLCGLVRPSVLWSAFGPAPAVGRLASRWTPCQPLAAFFLSATFILCMSSTASAAVLSHRYGLLNNVHYN